jgi:pimeloyl-ACP methyl ester carboxylesterase
MVHHDLDAARTPILLVHGIIDNHSIFTLMERALRRRGFRTVSTYDYGLLTRDIPSAAELLGEAIEKQVANTGYDRIHVVGHSLGRPDRALLRPAAGRRRPRAHAGDARHAPTTGRGWRAPSRRFR